MKKWIWFGFAGAMLLWLLGAWVLLPSVQSSLERAAIAELAKPEYTGAFDDVKVSFSGQEATLTGKVASQSDHDLLSTVIGERVRTPGSSLNPVTHVANGAARATELGRLRPKPWLLIAKFNGQGVIAGTLPSDLKDKASQALSAKLSGVKITNSLNTKLDPEAKVRLPLDANATLDAKNIPQLADDEVAVSTVGGLWKTNKSTKTDFEITNDLAGACESDAVIEALLPLRNYQAAEAEKARQATLPPAYAGIVALPEALHIFGLTGDDESQRKLLGALGTAYPKRKILTSAMKLSANIRNNSDWTSTLADLPKGDSDAFVAALPVGGKAVVYKDKGDQAAMQKALAAALPATFDFQGLWEPYGNWLKPPAPPPAPAPAPAPPAAATAPNLKIGAPTLTPAPAAAGTVPAPTLKLGPATPAAPAVKTLPPPSGNPPPSTVTIPPPAPAPAPKPAPAPAPAPVTPPAK